MGYSCPYDLVGRSSVEAHAIQGNRASPWLEEARDGAQECRLAGAVPAKYRYQFIPLDLK
jgi:hypothetical protein